MIEKDKSYQLRMISVCKMSGVGSVKQFFLKGNNFRVLKIIHNFAGKNFRVSLVLNFQRHKLSRIWPKFAKNAKVSALKVHTYIHGNFWIKNKSKNATHVFHAAGNRTSCNLVINSPVGVNLFKFSVIEAKCGRQTLQTWC